MAHGKERKGTTLSQEEWKQLQDAASKPENRKGEDMLIEDYVDFILKTNLLHILLLE